MSKLDLAQVPVKRGSIYPAPHAAAWGDTPPPVEVTVAPTPDSAATDSVAPLPVTGTEQDAGAAEAGLQGRLGRVQR